MPLAVLYLSIYNEKPSPQTYLGAGMSLLALHWGTCWLNSPVWKKPWIALCWALSPPEAAGPPLEAHQLGLSGSQAGLFIEGLLGL